MPNTGKNARGNRKHLLHDEAYWDRLRTEFETLTYNNSGAYNEIERQLTSEGVNHFRACVELHESELRYFVTQVDTIEKQQRMDRRLRPLEAYKKAARLLVESRRN